MKKKANFSGNVDDKDVVDLYRASIFKLGEEGVSVAALAADAGTRPARIYAYENDDAGTLVTVTTIIVTMAKIGPRLVLERMAQDAGYLLVKAPDIGSISDASTMTEVVDAMRETIEAIETFSAVIKDRNVTATEFKHLTKQIREAQAQLARLLEIADALRKKGRAND